MGQKQTASVVGFTIDNLRDVTPALETAGLIVIGGQALNYWADHFEIDGGPHTSKDLDLQGDKEAVIAAATALGTIARFSSTPMDVVNAGLIETESDGRQLEINILFRPFGLEAREVEDAAVPVEIAGATISVMHPFHVLVSRFANVSGLGRESEHALRQARASIVCLAAMIRERVEGEPREMLQLRDYVPSTVPPIRSRLRT